MIVSLRKIGETMSKILFVIDDVELKYFEWNDLVTDFWLIKEYLTRGDDVQIAVKSGLFVKNGNARGMTYGAFWRDNNLFYEKDFCMRDINDFDVVFFRPDPPVDVDYLNACSVFDFVDKNKTKLINNPGQIRCFNEKMHTHLFPKFVPDGIVTSKREIILDFLSEKGNLVIKPLNRCFGSGVFKLVKGDFNVNAIIDNATSNGKTAVCVQEFLDNGGGDKRIFIIGDTITDFSLRKLPGKGDFRFNTHGDDFFKADEVTNEEALAVKTVAKYLNAHEMPMCAVDVIDGKITEINVTSPCYFIREVNKIFGINFENVIMRELDKITDLRLLSRV